LQEVLKSISRKEKLKKKKAGHDIAEVNKDWKRLAGFIGSRRRNG